MDWGRKWLVDFNARKAQVVLFEQSNNTGGLDVKMDGSVLEENSSFKMLGLTFSSKLDWGSYFISIAKTASKKFFSPEVALHLYKFTMLSCIECCCHTWAGAPSYFLELLDKLQERACVDCWSFTSVYLKPFVDCQKVASLSLF